MAHHGDNSFGPQYGDQFDFTLRFELIILTILPASVLLTMYPILLYHYTHKPVVVSRSWSLYVKLAAAICWLGLEVGSLILWTHQPSMYPVGLAIIASAFSCATVCCIISLLHVEHCHSIQSSSLLSVYLSINIFFDATKARSCFSRAGDLNAIGSLLVAAAAFKGLIVVLEEFSKNEHILNGQRQPYNGEATGGFWNRALFLWVNKTLLAGYRNVLDIHDLEPLGPEFSAANLGNTFDPVWLKFQRKASSHRLMKALLWSLYQPVCAIILPRLCHTVFNFSQPLLIQRVILYINDEHASLDHAQGLIGATVLIYLGIAISKAVYTHLNYRLVTLARGILVEHILAKSLRIQYSDAAKKAALTHMDTDIEGLASGLPTLHDMWVGFVEVGVGAYLLTRVVGRASFLVAVPLIVSTIITMFIAKHMIPARKAWNDVIQHRVSETASLLASIKGIKLLGIESPVISYIQSLRVEELRRSKPFRIIFTLFNITAVSSEALTPVVVLGGFVFWVSPTHNLTAAEAFTCLSIIVLISQPLMNILHCATLFTPALACMQRIEDFLVLDERNDCRTALQTAGVLGDKATIVSSISNQRTSVMPSANPGDIFISGHLVSIKSQGGNSIIHDASFNIRRSALTVITGPVASGKSILIQALLGEVSFTGAIQFNPLGSIIAYCDQVPWIRNLSIRQNIIGEQPLDLVWYESVLNACLLVEDLSQLLEGDETMAGSNGANLSGGQKQRIALARALYSRAPVAIFDDVFSGLDPNTCATISHGLFGPNGLLRCLGTTVIMVSHSLLHASLADSILFLDGAGNIETRAPPQQLPSTDATILAALRHGGAEPSIENVEKTEISDDVLIQEKAKKFAEIEEQEDRTLRRKGDMSLYCFYFRSNKTWVVSVWLLLLAVSAITQQLPPLYLRIWLQLAPNNNRYFIGFGLLGLSGSVACAAVFLFFHLCAVPGSANRLHKMLLDNVMGATLSFLTETDSGVILNRFSQDMNLISLQLPGNFQFFLFIVGSCLISIGVLVSGARYFALILPLFLIILYTVQRFYLRTSRQMRYLDLEAKTPLYTHITETATGLYNIRASGLSDKVLHAGSELLSMSQKPYYYMFCIQRWLTLTLDLMAVGIATTLVSLGVLLPSTTSQTAIGLSLLNMISIGSDCVLLIQVWTMLETSLGALFRIRSFLKHTPQESETDGTVIPHRSWPESGHIVFNNLTASYSSTDVPTPVLRNVSLEIRAGQKVVILGRTGSGKSSLILALLNFLECSGSVCIDGIDIAKTPRHILRSRITTITQDSLKLDGTLRYNLLPFLHGKSEDSLRAYEEGVISMLCRVHLWDHVVSRGGLDTTMSDLNLSVGQLQLMSIARAALHHRLTGTNIVLMDEPTSSLDLGTDRHIQKEVFSELFGRCTVVMVAHRLETIRQAEVSAVVEMAEGMIISITTQ